MRPAILIAAFAPQRCESLSVHSSAPVAPTSDANRCPPSDANRCALASCVSCPYMIPYARVCMAQTRCICSWSPPIAVATLPWSSITRTSCSCAQRLVPSLVAPMPILLRQLHPNQDCSEGLFLNSCRVCAHALIDRLIRCDLLTD